jgi:hypothetical protein
MILITGIQFRLAYNHSFCRESYFTFGRNDYNGPKRLEEDGFKGHYEVDGLSVWFYCAKVIGLCLNRDYPSHFHYILLLDNSNRILIL